MDYTEKVSYLRDMLGAKLTAYLLRENHTADLGPIITGAVVPEPYAASTIDKAHITVTYLEGEGIGKSEIQTWMQGMNPALGDQSPAYLLRYDPSLRFGDVTSAAMAYVAKPSPETTSRKVIQFDDVKTGDRIEVVFDGGDSMTFTVKSVHADYLGGSEIGYYRDGEPTIYLVESRKRPSKEDGPFIKVEEIDGESLTNPIYALGPDADDDWALLEYGPQDKRFYSGDSITKFTKVEVVE